jgi:hypothetical protein
MALNVGLTELTIAMFKVAGIAQLPADGVNVYIAVPRTDVLILAGLHVPAIASFDTNGSAGGVEF